MKYIWIVLAVLVIYNQIPNDDTNYVPDETLTEEQEFLNDDVCRMEADEYIGADGHTISLVTNTSAIDPTYDQMISFIQADRTDRNEYIPESYTCGDFAEDVQNNAEIAGYNCAWVYIEFNDGTKHACNAFKTTDQGLIFIDCTRGTGGPKQQDCIVNVARGQEYTRDLIHENDYNPLPMGTVESYEIIWDGDIW